MEFFNIRFHVLNGNPWYTDITFDQMFYLCSHHIVTVSENDDDGFGFRGELAVQYRNTASQ